jgi:hypothetical protein
MPTVLQTIAVRSGGSLATWQDKGQLSLVPVAVPRISRALVLVAKPGPNPQIEAGIAHGRRRFAVTVAAKQPRTPAINRQMALDLRDSRQDVLAGRPPLLAGVPAG